MSTEVVTPSRAPAAPTSARIACAGRPRRPTMRRTSFGRTARGRVAAVVDGGGDAVTRSCGAYQRANCLRGATASTNDAAHVVRTNAEREDDFSLTLVDLYRDGVGVFGEGLRDELECGGRGRGLVGVTRVVIDVVARVVAGVVEVVLVVVVDGVNVAHDVLVVRVAHWVTFEASNASRAPLTFKSLATRSVGWAPCCSQCSTLSLSILRTISGSAVEIPRGW